MEIMIQKEGNVVIQINHTQDVPSLGIEPWSSLTVVFCAIGRTTSSRVARSKRILKGQILP